MNETDYALLNAQASALTRDEPDSLANLANLAALLFNTMSGINWAGFYLDRDGQLVLGPFQGQSACTRIPFGSGVCGTASAQNQILRVDNVHEFDGHIACDANSQSEIVIPLCAGQRVIAVLDIDSPVTARFDARDEAGLVQFAKHCEAAIAGNPESLGLHLPKKTASL